MRRRNHLAIDDRRFAYTFDLFEDIGVLCRPGEWLGVVVVLVDVLANRCDQLIDIAEDPVTEAILREVAKEPRLLGRPRQVQSMTVSLGASNGCRLTLNHKRLGRCPRERRSEVEGVRFL